MSSDPYRTRLQSMQASQQTVKSTTVDGTTVTNHDLGSLIEYEDWLAARSSRKRRRKRYVQKIILNHGTDGQTDGQTDGHDC